ncbi:uncharacterized protein LOC116942636 isoform X2 [Petromyzon marinus]|uniref:Zinc finger protein with KRAB and SCAN domains 3-like isoform X1 n=2 Tax=Petromyzon marinus TaxID=7757 RepID=A0AAJ7WUJ2_PETMA|nr:zinc finger protein with KRAB and SCAN domains 3-like isoform X1 [Petromyzon marinus]
MENVERDEMHGRMACLVGPAAPSLTLPAPPLPEPSGDFPAWLEAQGVNAEVARAMDSELGIRDYGVLRACVGDGLVRAELLAAARDRLPFGFYAVLRRFVAALLLPDDPRAPSIGAAAGAAAVKDATLVSLVEALLALLAGLSREFSACVGRLDAMDIGALAAASSAGGGEGAHGLAAAEEGAEGGGERPDQCGEAHSAAWNELKRETCYTSQGETSEVPVPMWPEIKTEPVDLAQGPSAVSSRCPTIAFVGSACRQTVDDELAALTPDAVALAQPRLEEEGAGWEGEGAEWEGEGGEEEVCDDEAVMAATATFAADTRVAPEQRNDPAEHSAAAFAAAFAGVPDAGRNHRPERSRPCKRSFCERRFEEPAYLKRHERTHAGEKPHRCDACGRAFARRSGLEYHRRVHTGERPYGCEVCGRAFAQYGNLKVHRRTHTGERPHRCDVCGRSFTLFSGLKYHARTHTGEKPYRCDVCGRSFSQCSNMKTHQRTHLAAAAANTCP